MPQPLHRCWIALGDSAADVPSAEKNRKPVRHGFFRERPIAGPRPQEARRWDLIVPQMGREPALESQGCLRASAGDGQSVAQAPRLRVLAASRRQKRKNYRARRPVNSQARTPGEDACATLSTALGNLFAPPFIS